MKRTHIPDDFQVSARITELARQNGWPDPKTEVDAFKDYHLAHGTLMLDWEAAFRTWLRNCVRFGKVPAIKPPPGKPIIKPQETLHHEPRVHELLGGLIEKLDVRKKA